MTRGPPPRLSEGGESTSGARAPILTPWRAVKNPPTQRVGRLVVSGAFMQSTTQNFRLAQPDMCLGSGFMGGGLILYHVSTQAVRRVAHDLGASMIEDHSGKAHPRNGRPPPALHGE